MNSSTNYSLVINQIMEIFIYPLVSVFPVVINLLNAYSISKTEFKILKFRKFKLFYLIDLLLFITTIFQPFAECKEFCDNWWSSNYWFMFYKLYVSSYLTQVLSTISSIFCVRNAWNRYKIMNEYEISGLILYIILSLNFMASFLLNMSPILLTDIIPEMNNNNTHKNILKSNHIYYLKTTTIEFDGKYFLIHFICAIIILIINLILVVRFGVIIKTYINSKTCSKISSPGSKDQIKRSSKKRRESVVLYKHCSSLNSLDLEIVLREIDDKNLSNETSLICFLMLIIFVIDQFFKYFCIIFFYKIDRNSKEYLILWIIYVSLVFIIQFSQIFSFYKFNTAFKKRLKYLCNYSVANNQTIPE